MRRMGFWPFGGREPADVESASRIVTAATRDFARVRGKLTLHFKEPQTKTAADKAVERCALLTEELFHELVDHEHLLSAEPELAAKIRAQLPSGVPAMRSVELTSLHVVSVGNAMRRVSSPFPARTLEPQRAATRTIAALPDRDARDPSGARPPQTARAATPQNVRPALLASMATPPLGHLRLPSSLPPPSTARSPPGAGALRWRGPPGAARAGGSVLPSLGSPPSVIATSLAPLLRDAAARLFLGCLHAHELIIVRRVALDITSSELLAVLLPTSDAPPGEFEASRTAEITRWHATLGSPVIGQLRAESCVLSAFQARSALNRTDIAPSTATDMIEALCRTAFPGLALSLAQMDRYSERELSDEAADSVARVLRHPNSNQLRILICPLLDALNSDIEVLARLAQMSLGSSA
jgi:hypothetical protein